MRWVDRRLSHPRHSPAHPSRLRSVRFSLPLALLLILINTTPGFAQAAPAPAPASPDTSTATVDAVTIVVEGASAVDANAIAQQNANAIRTAADESAALFAVAPNRPLTVTFVTAADPAVTATMRPVRDFAWASVDGAHAIVLHDRFTQLSAAEAANVFRNLISRPAMQAAAGGNLPAGLMDGIARYFERPILASQARAGSLVQAAYQQGILPDLAPIVNLGASTLDPETATATRYALVAFVADRYGVGTLQKLVQSFATEPIDWQASFSTALQQPIDQVQAAWKDFLPRWFASGWQSNAIDAFDLAPAQTLFDRGAYAAAADRAGLSQQLFTALGDQQRLAKVETLLALCAVGVQAETLMTDTQQALSDHDYARAQSLLVQADQQYSLLPEEHRPTGILQTYHQLTNDGLIATAQFDRASSTAHDWLRLRSSRADALDSGTTFARLGDTARAEAARRLLATIDTRVQRLAMILGTIAILLVAWFGIWMWSRAPRRFLWPAATDSNRDQRRKGAGRWSFRP